MQRTIRLRENSYFVVCLAFWAFFSLFSPADDVYEFVAILFCLSVVGDSLGFHCFRRLLFAFASRQRGIGRAAAAAASKTDGGSGGHGVDGSVGAGARGRYRLRKRQGGRDGQAEGSKHKHEENADKDEDDEDDDDPEEFARQFRHERTQHRLAALSVEHADWEQALAQARVTGMRVNIDHHRPSQTRKLQIFSNRAMANVFKSSNCHHTCKYFWRRLSAMC